MSGLAELYGFSVCSSLNCITWVECEGDTCEDHKRTIKHTIKHTGVDRGKGGQVSIEGGVVRGVSWG